MADCPKCNKELKHDDERFRLEYRKNASTPSPMLLAEMHYGCAPPDWRVAVVVPRLERIGLLFRKEP